MPLNDIDFSAVDLNTLPTPVVNTILSNPHPSQVVQFVNSDYNSRMTFAQANPQLYAQIYNFLSKNQNNTTITEQTYENEPVTFYDNRQTNSNELKIAPPITRTTASSNEHQVYHDDSSELSNYHSSDEELNQQDSVKPEEPPALQRKQIIQRDRKPPPSTRVATSSSHKNHLTVQQQNSLPRNTPRNNNKSHVRYQHDNETTIHLALDFRRDLNDITSENEYVLTFPKKHNISRVSLSNCVLSCNDRLLNEPYVYVSIKEIPGSYAITGTEERTVLGKLIQKQTMNGFLFYEPENCVYEFHAPQRLSSLTVSFLDYKLDPIALNNINVKNMKRSKKYMKLETKGDHCLKNGNGVNICYKHTDKYTMESLEIVDVSSDNSVILSKPSSPIMNNDLSFSVTNVKCAMTFNLTSYLPH